MLVGAAKEVSAGAADQPVLPHPHGDSAVADRQGGSSGSRPLRKSRSARAWCLPSWRSDSAVVSRPPPSRLAPTGGRGCASSPKRLQARTRLRRGCDRQPGRPLANEYSHLRSPRIRCRNKRLKQSRQQGYRFPWNGAVRSRPLYRRRSGSVLTAASGLPGAVPMRRWRIVGTADQGSCPATT